MKRKSLMYTVRGGIIAALYLTLTLIFAPISFGAVQFRISEALTVLPMYFPEAVPALFVGCLLSNTVSSFGVADMVFGSLATLVAACITSRMKNKYLAPLPSVVINAAVIGAMTAFMSSTGNVTVFLTVFVTDFLTVGIGQAAVCYLLGVPLAAAVGKIMPKFNKKKTRM